MLSIEVHIFKSHSFSYQSVVLQLLVRRGDVTNMAFVVAIIYKAFVVSHVVGYFKADNRLPCFISCLDLATQKFMQN